MSDIQDLSECEDFDPEIWEILNHEEPRTEFTSMPPRGVIRPVPIRLMPTLSLNEEKTSTLRTIGDSLTHRNRPTCCVIKTEALRDQGQNSLIGGGEGVSQSFGIAKSKKCDELVSSNKSASDLTQTNHKKEKKPLSFFDHLRNLFRRIRG